MKWSEILTKDEQIQISTKNRVGVSYINNCWGKYGARKHEVIYAIKNVVEDVLRISNELKREIDYDFDEDGYLIFFISSPTDEELINWQRKSTNDIYTKALVRELSKTIDKRIDLIQEIPPMSKIDNFHIGRLLLESDFPDVCMTDEIRQLVYEYIGHQNWGKICQKFNFSGKKFGLTWFDGKPHSSSDKEFVITPDGSKNYYCLGVHFMSITNRRRVWNCSDPQSKDWEFIISHVKAKLVHDIMES